LITMNKRSITAIGAGIALASSAGVMAVSGLGAVSVVPAMPTQEVQTQDAQIQGPQADEPAPQRCAECGRIESVRDIPSGADNRATRIREYTVRMADGSRHTFTSDVRWRVGESLTVVARAGRRA
jgi:hypothetical protein